MGGLLGIARWIKGTSCQRLVKQTANEIRVDGAGFGVEMFKIDIGSWSNKIKQFYRVTQTMVTMDNSQFLLCDQISRLRDEDQLKDVCVRTRLQLIIAFGQLHAILGSINERPVDELDDELARWVRYMSRLNRKCIAIVGPVKKGLTDKDKSELEQIMKYQGISESEMQEAMDTIK